MHKTDQITQQQMQDSAINSAPEKGAIDLVVLSYMARKIRVLLHSMEHPIETALPWLYYLQESRGRAHRIAIYAPQALPSLHDCAFVGFISRKQQSIDPFIAHELHRVDQQLLGELVGISGLLAYSSLELHAGNWYNLVLLNDASDRAHFKDIAIHRYAAYQLAPHYYEWIRLHSGTLHGGLAGALILQKTKYYRFQREKGR
ncbi:MAG TPA: hypothetical protein VKV37_18110 [Ktedonobacteraceae bacterium]|jgi:hypothetical protein|nr:hypothetical protein [Ktedonobacteraceae bacterium]